MLAHMTLRTACVFSGVVFAASLSGFVSTRPLAQETGFNHLDCWFDQASNAVKCPTVGALQEGRGSRTEIPEHTGSATSAVPVPKPAPPRNAAPESRAVEVAGQGPETPSCRRYRTYDAATHTYRGYDGVVRKCRGAR